ncbi:radical SAM protein [Solwaraspora sp. WMMB335]|uniref:radical SAM protein n=1 Tax=Solwaraspora sp. WMMB335 TaxID=3404118 RepID=UPI003B94869D
MAAERPLTMGKGVLVMTYACNLKCSFCYAGVEVFHRPKTMPYAEACRGVDFLASLGITTYTLLGGEPTIHRDLIRIVEYSAGRAVAPWLVTNGVKVADPAYAGALVAAGLKGGCISLHGLDADAHDAATGIAGSHDAALRAVRLAAAEGWPLYPMLTVMAANLDSVLPTIRSLVDLGCRTIYINYGVPNVVPGLDVGAASGPQELARLTERLFRMQPELGVRFVFNREKNKIPLCHFDHDTLQDMFTAEVIGTGCEAAQGNTIVIEPGGKVLGCSHWVDHPLTNIYRDYAALELVDPDEFWAAWTTGRPAEFRHDLRFYPYEQCGGCGWRTSGQCFGGCKVWQSAGVLPKAVAFDGEAATGQQDSAVVPHRPVRSLPLQVLRG